MTGWGQKGPLSHASGHDINYLALSGALHYAGHDGEAPFSPATLIGDVGGGGLMLAFGICAAIVHTQRTGEGQVIDAAITDGSAVMTALLYGVYHRDLLSDDRSESFFSGASHWYDSYQCADDGYITLGSLEPNFYAEFLEKFGLADKKEFDAQFDAVRWPELKRRMTKLIKTRTRQQWCNLLEGTGVCFAPVLNFEEAPRHPHNEARQTFLEVNGVTQPAPAPRFSRTPPEIFSPPPDKAAQTDTILQACGFTKDEIESLKTADIL